MKYKIVILFIVAAFMVLSIDAQPAPGSALLYKITGKNLKTPSYVFGTIHIVCEKDLIFAEALGKYVTQTEQMMLETDLDDPAALKRVVEASTLKDGKTLRDFLTREEFSKLDELYKSHLGISVELLQTLKPIVVNSYLFMSPKIIGCPKPSRLDKDLADVAKHRNSQLIPLETLDQQIAALDSVPITEQVRALKEISSTPDKQIDLFRTMYKAYIAQDSEKLYEISVKEMSPGGYSQSALLDDRNRKWIPLIESQIARKPTFIGFGAGHLAGKNGVVALLRAKGYTLTPIRL